MKVITAFYDTIRTLMQDPEAAEAEMADTIVPDVCQWYPGMLQRFVDATSVTRAEPLAKLTPSKSASAPSEVSTPAVTNKGGLGLMSKVLDKSKAIKKPDGTAYFSKLQRKYPKAFDELRECREGLKAAEAQKIAYNERIRAILTIGPVFADVDSACDEGQEQHDEM